MTTIEMIDTTIETINTMKIGAPQIIEVGKPNRKSMEEIDNLATNAHNTTIRRRINAYLTITIDATRE